MIQFRSLRMGACRLLSMSIATWLALGGVAAAQQIAGGITRELATRFVRGVDSAFDPNTNTFLVVGGQGSLVGVCINSSGVAVAGPFTINNTGHAQFPRVRYSPHVLGTGGFLVAWPEEAGAFVDLRARTVNCSGAMGAEQVISGGHSAWLESGAALAYSSTSQRFLVAWKSFPGLPAGAPIRLKVTLVNTSGARVSDVVNVSPEFGRDPGVAWDPTTNQFGVSFNGENGSGSVAYSAFAVVPAWNPAGFTRQTFNSIAGGMTTISDLAFNTATKRYVMTWFEFSSGALARIAEFGAAGNLLAMGTASGRLGSYDALSIAYNPVSGTFLLGGVDRTNDAMLGLELNSRGFPFNGENTVSSSHRPSYYTRVSSSTHSKSWNGTFAARNFNGMGSVMVTGFASGGGPAGAFGSSGGATPPPSSPPPPTGCTTIQPGPGWTCVNGGWLPPTTTPPPSTGTCTTMSPGPGWVCVNGGWLPPTTTGGSGGGCSTPKPVSNWVCVNGGWVPPDSPLAPTSCSTPRPGTNWVCVNGGWLPPDLAPSTGGGGGGCSTVKPVSNWVCVNGGWVPPDSPLAPTSCTTPRPGTNWVCVNGGWLPPDQAPATSAPIVVSSCPGSAPAAGWVCVNGGWVPPNHPLVTGGGD